MAYIIIVSWLAAGLLGGWLFFRDGAEFKSQLRRIPAERCPTPVQIIFIVLGSLFGVAPLIVAIIVCMAEDGMWHRADRFKWWFTPICKSDTSKRA